MSSLLHVLFDRPRCLATHAICRSLLSLFSLLSPHVSAEWVSDNAQIMGTTIEITLWHEDRNQALRAVEAVFSEMRRIDNTLSPYKETSELSRLNRLAAKIPQVVSAEMLFLLDKSLYMSRISHGAFDITYASVGWYYDYRQKRQPSNEKRKRLLPAINYRLIDLNQREKTVHFGHPNIRIDLGGIAKGHAVDNALNIVRQYEIKHASISAGGDSRLLGDRRGRPWVVGIKKPRAQNGSQKVDPAILLPLENVAVSTSGDYERYFIDTDSGERVHHIINPKTGKSAGELASVTVLGPLGVNTDPLSTTVFVLGVTEGLALINRLPGFDCVLIDRRGKVHYSDELVPPDMAQNVITESKKE